MSTGDKQNEEKFRNLIELYQETNLNEQSGEAHQKNLDLEKKKHATERCYLLYEKGKIKNEVNRLMYQKNNELKEQKELSQCTFRPKTNTNYRRADNVVVRNDNIDTYNRNIYWKSRNIEK